MAVVSYKCPRCGAPLEYTPESGRFECAYCGGSYTENDLKELQPATASEQTVSVEDVPAQEGSGDGEEVLLYTCPSCGARIVTDETTAATTCLYCHSPVVLEGRLKGKFRPDHTGESVGYQGYSIYAMDYTWSNEERCIRLRTLRPGDTIQTEFGPAIIKYLTPADAYGYYFVEGMENTEMHPIHFAGIQCELQDTPCIDVTDIPSSFGIRGSAEDGVYTITAPTAKKVTYAQATAYNGPLNYTQIRLIVSVPLCINGQFINTEEGICILAPDDPSLYVSAKLLSENTGYTFENY